MNTDSHRYFFLIRVHLCPICGSHSYAAIAAPPGIFVPTGVVVGPACLRSLNQKAVNQTFAPGVISDGKATSTRVREVLPSNFQPPTSAGGLAPTKEKSEA